MKRRLGERILTSGFHNEGPTFAPNGRVVMFFRDPGGNGGPSLFTVDISGRNEQRVPTPGFAPIRHGRAAVVAVCAVAMAGAHPGRQTLPSLLIWQEIFIRRIKNNFRYDVPSERLHLGE